MTLHELFQIIEPPLFENSMTTLVELLDPARENSLRRLFELSSGFCRISQAPLTYHFQNMGLLVAPAPYGGTERDTSIQSLIGHLKSKKPDIVGLCECFSDGERELIRNDLAGIYSYWLEGPDEEDLESDGGLLLLSQHRIVENHQTIYRQCLGEDCLTNKGALHARVEVDRHPSQYDVFLSHMQSCPPNIPTPNVGPGETCEEKLHTYQVEHLAAFIQAYSSPLRPSLLMGDLNHDGRSTDVYRELIRRLNYPDDLWNICGDGSDGITCDDFSSFWSENPQRDVLDPGRHRSGARYDYQLSWRRYAIFKPIYTRSEIVIWQSSPGRDISDHYGLRATQSCVGEVNVDTNQAIHQITLTLKSFRCLTETGGSVPGVTEAVEDDEVEFELRSTTAYGVTNQQKTELVEDINRGSYHEFSSPVTLTLGDPGDSLTIEVEGWEVDYIGGLETGRVSLGPEHISLDRRQLLTNKGHTVERVLPLLLGDGGEYAVNVAITVR